MATNQNKLIFRIEFNNNTQKKADELLLVNEPFFKNVAQDTTRQSISLQWDSSWSTSTDENELIARLKAQY